jgi:hypothetical protein
MTSNASSSQIEEVTMPQGLEDLTRLAQTSRRGVGPVELADAIIRDCDGDARSAVISMVKINHALMIELRALTGRPLHSLAGRH